MTLKTVGDVFDVLRARRVRCHFIVTYGIDRESRLVMVPKQSVFALLTDLPRDMQICARLDDRDLVIG